MRYKLQIGLILLLLLLGCDKKTTDDPVVAIAIVPQATVVLGNPLQMSALGQTLSGANTGPVAVTWQSDDPDIVTVDGNGLLSGVKIGLAELSARNETFSASVSVGVVSPLLGGKKLNISGKASYEDKPYTKDGFTGQLVNTPIRRAAVGLIAIDGFATLATAYTEEDGSYSFSDIDNSGRRGGVYLSIQAKTADNSASPAVVRNNQTEQLLLAYTGPALDDSSTNSNFASADIVVPANGIGGAFNILDAFLKGGAFIQKPGFCPTASFTACKAPFLTAFWEPGGNTGSSFESGTPAISISGGGPTKGDTDEYDDTVILHEYGHFIASIFSHDDSPGGSHFIGDSTQDMRLSWSEGWGTFFASAVLGSPLAVDTSATKSAFKFNIDTNDTNYTTDELSNSSVLWDTLTATDFPSVWASFRDIPAGAIATMEAFAFGASGFITRNQASVLAFKAILEGRKIEFFPDLSDGQESDLVVGASQHHTLYLSDTNPVGDEDIIPFNVIFGRKYTIKTNNLTNGADTFLTLNNAGIVLTNDNAINCGTCLINNLNTLASSITFTANTTGALSVSVKPSPTAPPSAGLTGSYNITLTSP